MYTLRSVGVLSCAKIMGAIYGCLGLIFVPIFLLVGFASLISGKSPDSMSGFAMLALCLLLPILYGVMGFVMGAFSAWLYNMFARWLGGIQMDFKSGLESPATPLTVPGNS
jgi:hypothetical protein